MRISDWSSDVCASDLAESAKHGVEFGSHAITSPDPAIDLDERLGREAHEIGADLIVMGSHVPGFAEHLFASNAGYLASHAEISVFRSEERRVGKECVGTCRSRWSRQH